MPMPNARCLLRLAAALTFAVAASAAWQAHGGSGEVIRTPAPGVRNTSGLILEIDTQWVERLNAFLDRLSDRARLPAQTEFHVLVGKFEDAMTAAPGADINVFGLADKLPFKFMREAPELTKSSCLFIRDSGQESALA